MLKAWQCPTFTWDLPHYHRRRAVSLPSSEWDRVVHTRYSRQANWLGKRLEKGRRRFPEENASVPFFHPFFLIRKVAKGWVVAT